MASRILSPRGRREIKWGKSYSATYPRPGVRARTTPRVYGSEPRCNAKRPRATGEDVKFDTVLSNAAGNRTHAPVNQYRRKLVDADRLFDSGFPRFVGFFFFFFGSSIVSTVI